KSGTIISIGTNLYQNPVVPYHEYTTDKSSLIGFTRNIAAEIGQYDIKANIVSGGLLKTTDTRAATSDEVFDLIEQTTPLYKITIVQFVVYIVVFLVNDQANCISGQNITVDGSLTMN